MKQLVESKGFYEFGDFRIDVENRLLWRRGEMVPLQPRTFDILLLFVESNGRVLSKEEVMGQVWGDTIVEESNLSQNIYLLRKILDADADGKKYIETIPKRGYRFIAEVKEIAGLPVSEPADKEEATAADEIEEAKKPSVDQPAEPSRRTISKPFLLTAVLLGVLLIAVLSVSLYYLLNHRSSSAKPIQSIAVLPFQSLDPSGDDNYIGDGLADDLATRLSATRKLIVRPTSVVLQAVAKEQDPAAVGRALAVDAVLTGSVRRADDRIRVNVQLVRIADSESLWVDQFDDRTADILTLQDRLSERLATALPVELSGRKEQLFRSRYTNNAEAFDLYLKAYSYWKKRTREGYNVAIDYLQQALKKDDRYALAYTGLAACHSGKSMLGFASPKEAMPEAEAMAKRALEIDPTLPNAHTSLAIVRTFYDWDLPAAEKEFRQAIDLDANLPEAHQYYGVCLAAMGRFEEAREQLEAARRIDSGSLVLESSIIWASYLARRYDEAIAQGKRAIEREANFYLFHHQMAQAYTAKGVYESAIAALQKARLLSGDVPLVAARLGYAYALAGKKQEAHELLKHLQENAAPPHSIAWIFIGLQDRKQAIEWLEKALAARSGDLIYLKTDTIYDPLRDSPEFIDLLRRVGFTP